MLTDAKFGGYYNKSVFVRIPRTDSLIFRDIYREIKETEGENREFSKINRHPDDSSFNRNGRTLRGNHRTG